jgi:hypothetical protein
MIPWCVQLGGMGTKVSLLFLNFFTLYHKLAYNLRGPSGKASWRSTRGMWGLLKTSLSHTYKCALDVTALIAQIWAGVSPSQLLHLRPSPTSTTGLLRVQITLFICLRIEFPQTTSFTNQSQTPLHEGLNQKSVQAADRKGARPSHHMPQFRRGP